MLNYEEFYDYVWLEVISTRIVPNQFRREQKELIQELTFDYYRFYTNLPNLHENVFAKMLESVFSALLRSNLCRTHDYTDEEQEGDFNDASLSMYEGDY